MRISKKIVALIMAALMAFSLFACSSKDSGSPQTSEPVAPESSAPAEIASPSENAPAPSEDASVPEEAAAEPGYYDPNKDYFDRNPYKVGFVILSVPTSMHQMFIDAYGLWGTNLNYELTDFSANDNNDTYISMLETLATQDYDGFFLDFPTEIRDRTLEICEEYELIWFPGLSMVMDDDGNLLHPSLTIDNYGFGSDMTQWLVENAENEWGACDESTLGFMSIDFSVIADIHVRERGAYDKLVELLPDVAENRYFVADGSSVNSFSAETAYNLTGAIFAAHPEIEHWMIASTMDDFAAGAARAAEAADKDGVTLIIATGGTTLVTEWDAGSQSCWKAAIYYEAMLASSTICAGLISMIDGETTKETLWPKWVEDGQTYAKLIAPCHLLTHDNYTEFFEWVDEFTGLELHDYNYNGTQFEYNV